MLRIVRSTGSFLFWTLVSWSCCLLLSLASTFWPLDLSALPPWLRLLPLQTWLVHRLHHVQAVLKARSYKEVALLFFWDATWQFRACAREIFLVLFFALFGPLIAESLEDWLPGWLRRFFVFVRNAGRGRREERKERDDLWDDSLPPPLEDCGAVSCPRGFVFDPVFGVVEEEVAGLWRVEALARDSKRLEAIGKAKNKILPPVRYSEES
eukprot:gene6404-7059_t